MISSIARSGLGLALALPLAFVVVSAMARVIYVEEIELKKEEPFELRSIVPDVEKTESRTRRRTQASRRDTNKKPPAVKKLKINKADINIKPVNMDVAPPTKLNLGRMASFNAVPIAINDRDARPIRPPPQNYPQRALEKGLEGSCEVSFNVDVRGKPYDVNAVCTSNLFKREAEKSVSRAEFSPKVKNGKPVERRGVVYPMEFVLAG